MLFICSRLFTIAAGCVVPIRAGNQVFITVSLTFSINDSGIHANSHFTTSRMKYKIILSDKIFFYFVDKKIAKTILNCPSIIILPKGVNSLSSSVG